MTKQTKSIIDELSEISQRFDKAYIIENNAINAIAATSNLIQLIRETYDKTTADDLEKRLMNSIKTGDEKKFVRGIKQVHESHKRQKF